MTTFTRVKSLTYKVISGKTVDYNNAPEISEETEGFTFTINSEKAIFTLKENIFRLKDARNIIESFLERWETLIGLEHDPGDLVFKYEDAEYENIVLDDGNNGYVLHAEAGSMLITGLDAVIHVSRNRLPNRPYQFKLTPDVKTMYDRYKLYRQGKESLTSMAYLCLTVLEASARNSVQYNKSRNLRGKASYQYSIEYDVLDNLAKLVSTKGDQEEARKAPKNGVFDPLKPEERNWIEKVVKIILRRVGEYAFDPQSKQTVIKFADL